MGHRPQSPSEIENFAGKIGAETEVQAKDYDCYIALDFVQATIKPDGTTVIDIDYKLTLKSLDVDGFHYFPVVTKFTSVKFYKDIGVEIKPAKSTGYEVTDLKDAHYYLGDASFKAVRSVRTSFNSVYGTEVTPGPKSVLPSWASANLKIDESVEKLSEQSEPSGEPKINEVGLSSIFRAYNPDGSISGFGGGIGYFWSCVVEDIDTNLAYI